MNDNLVRMRQSMHFGCRITFASSLPKILIIPRFFYVFALAKLVDRMRKAIKQNLFAQMIYRFQVIAE